jgi:hypothetical protein
MPTARKPLVFDDNKNIQQLQPGDIIAATVSGGDNYPMLNSSGGTIIAGSAVSCNTALGHIVKADGQSSATVAQARVMGLLLETAAAAETKTVMQAGNMVLSTGEWDILTGDSGGLVLGPYYLDTGIPGVITSSPPSTGYVVKIGEGIKDDTMFINIEQPIKL